jgi:prevent-host-death family protein
MFQGLISKDLVSFGVRPEKVRGGCPSPAIFILGCTAPSVYPNMAIKYGHILEDVMKTIAATDFKAHCLALLEEVRQTRQSLIVTRHGRPVAEISPYVAREVEAENPLKGSILHQGDIVSPLDVRWGVKGNEKA